VFFEFGTCDCLHVSFNISHDANRYVAHELVMASNSLQVILNANHDVIQDVGHKQAGTES